VADGLGPGGVDGGQGQGQPGRRGGGGLGGGMDLAGAEREDHPAGPARGAEPGGGAGEDQAGLLAVPGQ